MLRPVLLSLLLISLCAACDQKHNAPVTSNKRGIKQRDSTATTRERIISGESVPIKGRRVDPDSVDKPQSTPLRSRPEVTFIQENVFPVGKPKVIPIPEKLPVIIPGENGIPEPQTFWVRPKVIPAIQPKPVFALPPKMKEQAVGNIKSLSISQGLGSALVHCILEDSRNNLWFGTAGGGVSHYDGKRFTNYTVKEGLSHQNVWSMLEDSQGNIWFGTGAGVNCYNGQNFTNFTLEKGLSDNRVRSILEDNRGNLWFGTWGGGVARFDPAEDGTGGCFTHYTTKEGLSNNMVESILQDSQGAIWFGTIGGGVTRFDPNETGTGGSFTHYTTEEGLSSNTVQSILEDSQGHLWFGTSGGGVSRYNPAEDGTGGSFTHYTTEVGLSNNFVESILEDSRGNLWFGTYGGGVTHYNPNEAGPGGSFTHYTTKEGLSSNTIYSVLEDSQGNIWFGTIGGGAIRFAKQNFIHYMAKVNLNGSIVLAIYEDRQGNIWFGSQEKGVSRYNPPDMTGGKGTLTHYKDERSFSSNNIASILEDSQGNLWFGSLNDGVARYDPDETRTGGNFTHLTTDHGLSANSVSSILEDNKGNLWFGTRSDGMNRYDGKTFLHYTSEDGLSHDNIRSILEDKRGNLWFGKEAKSEVSCYNGLSLTDYSLSEVVVYNTITSMLEDEQDNLWFAAHGGGAVRYTPSDSSFYTYTTTDGLISDHVRSIAQDKQNYIWVNTSLGLSVLIPRHDHSTTAADDYEIFNLGAVDGAKTAAFGFRNMCIDQRNQLWWAMDNGVGRLNLNHLELPTDTPRVRLDYLEIHQTMVDFRRLSDSTYRQSLPFGEKLAERFDSVVAFYNYPLHMVLPYDLNHLTFHFAAIDWDWPGQLKYTYWMDGLDKAWSPLSSEGKADYRNLPPGKHTLKIKAIGAAHKWSEVFEYEFQVLPPWWLTVWAYLGYFLLGAAIIWGYVRWQTYSLRVRVLQKTQEIRVQQKRSDDLLLNILPAEVAQELKETGGTRPVFFEDVSILFADFKGFTNIVASIPGKVLVQELDEIFNAYDDIVEEVGLEKIQTVGDAYLAACGLPTIDPHHAKKCVLAAKRIIAFLEKRNKTEAIKWSVRIGIHSGPITAGVIGKKKYSYDLFGDTINIAARIESASEPSRINVSAYTYRLIKGEIPCTYRGKIDAKGKGDLDMYFVD